MTVLGGTLALHWNGSTGSLTRDPRGQEYTAVWRVQVDDPLDQSKTVLEWCEASGPVKRGDNYAYANDTAAAATQADRISANRVTNTNDWWEIVAQYVTPDDQTNEDENGDPTDDPLQWRPDIRTQTVQYQRPVDTSKFLGGYHGWAAAMFPAGQFATPCNSAGVPFNPRPMMDDSRTTLLITRNLAVYDADEADDVVNGVNLNTFEIDKFGFRGIYPARVAKVRGWNASLRRANGVDFWQAQLAIGIDRRRHIDQILDQGLNARAAHGDPNGRGGFFSPSDPWPPGMPRLRRLLDKNMQPISEPVLFDGDGQALDLTIAPVVPVFGTWLHYHEVDYLAMTFLDGIIQAANQ